MRWLFGLLLLANLVLFLWPTSDPAVGDRAAAPTVPGVPPLVLLGERPKGPEAPPVPAAPATPPPQTATAAPPPPAPAAEEVTPPIAPPQPAPEPVAGDQCLRIGPFASEARARAAAAQLAERQVYATLGAEGEAREARYIVYLPAAASRAAAMERLRELQAKGIDSFIMGGSLRNAISLGVFSQEDSALRLVAKMEQRGYAVELYSQPRETPSYWLELGRKNSDRLTEDAARALQRRYPEARHESRPCP